MRRLRWTALAGQVITVLYVVRTLKVPLPVEDVAWVIAFAASTNVGLYGVPDRVGQRPGFLASVLGLDVVLLTLLLRLTGGPYNPFSTLYLVLVALAAVALTPVWTWAIAAVSGLGYAFLFVAPLWPARPGDPICGVGPNLPLSIHLRGMVIAFVLTMALVAFFASRLQQSLRRHQRELDAARERSHQHERFAALATLAAGAAHELGTPLGTIVVAAGELAREARAIPTRPSLASDAELIRTEAFRCRAILDRLQHHAEDAPRIIAIPELLEALRRRFPRASITSDGPASSDRCLIAPPDALNQALANLIENAQAASPADGPIDVVARFSERRIEFSVTDRGAGMDAVAQAHAGEPFFTTKPAGKGMGLGLFLVRLLARRLTGEFRLEPLPEGGTRAVLVLPLTPTCEEGRP